MQIRDIIAVVGAGLFAVGLLATFACGCGGPAEPVVAAAEVRSGFRLSLETFRSHTGRYPSTAESLRALLTPPAALERWSGPYLVDTKSVPRDPWGHDYRYRSPGLHNPERYDLWSPGPDGVESADEIGNW